MVARYNSCGAPTEIGRRSYTTRARLYDDGPLFEILWYPALNDVPFKRGPNAISSNEWQADRPDEFDMMSVGEDPNYPRKYLYTPKKDQATGGHTCGTPADWAGDGVYDPLPPFVEYRPDGLPTCCGPYIPPFLGPWVFEAPGAHEWIPPVSGNYRIECWGAGGDGFRGSLTFFTGGGGGGGGAYSRSDVVCTAGVAHGIIVAPRNEMGNTVITEVEGPGGVLVSAESGGWAFEAASGLGGTTAGSVGQQKWAGGRGFIGQFFGSGGGGGAGAFGVTGPDAVGPVGGVAVYPSGSGGNGPSFAGPITAGYPFGGGGAGGFWNDGEPTNGAGGRVFITYLDQ